MPVSSSDRILRSVCKRIGRCICDSGALSVTRRSSKQLRVPASKATDKAIAFWSSRPAAKSNAVPAQRPSNSPPALALVPVTQAGVGNAQANEQPTRSVGIHSSHGGIDHFCCSWKILFWAALLVATVLLSDSWMHWHRANDGKSHAMEMHMLIKAGSAVLRFWYQILSDFLKWMKLPVSEVVQDNWPQKVLFDASELRQAMKGLEQEISRLDTTSDINKQLQVIIGLKQSISQLDTTTDVIKLRQAVASLEQRISQLDTSSDVNVLRQAMASMEQRISQLDTSSDVNQMRRSVKSLEQQVSNIVRRIDQTAPPHQKLDKDGNQKVSKSVEYTKWKKDDLAQLKSTLESQIQNLAGKIQRLTRSAKAAEDISKLQQTVGHLERQLTSLTQSFQSVVSVGQTTSGSATMTAVDIMPDYALESGGARVVSTLDSKPFKATTFGFNRLWRRLHWSPATPDTVLTPTVLPGSCWPFVGFPGRLLVKLSYPIRVSAISIDHIERRLSYNDSVASAPREFTVYGLTSSCVKRDAATKLGSFAYNAESGPPTQTFLIVEVRQELYPYVELVIHSNHGNPEYTCLYRFRVHGHMK